MSQSKALLRLFVGKGGVMGQKIFEKVIIHLVDTPRPNISLPKNYLYATK